MFDSIQSTPPWDEVQPRPDHPGPFAVMHRPHGRLNIETRFYGPFDSFDEAYDAMASIPALGFAAELPGVKWIVPLERLP
ncbi:hypothetical protein [Brevundimonas sp.]|jgi:hypothetical protein|uniref:hypothetical protein n=1 Tax=Brevundimonas sp. TaxID=1871086 RepID=UPI0025C57A0B|nr:hypothetical protein [Brevundimonas sp.]|tara:strand:+ start:68417 stop:68656 length:240 start_codon:yes stop_codon:yes gene_type:complete